MQALKINIFTTNQTRYWKDEQEILKSDDFKFPRRDQYWTGRSVCVEA